MAPSGASKLPPPPADLSSRTLPLRRIRGPLFRIHISNLACLYFGTSIAERFDDPMGEYGVLYAALNPESAFAEVFLRQLSLMLILESDLEARSLSEFTCVPIDCVDLTGAGLRTLSCDNRISTEKPYRTTGLWSRALFEHPQQPAGLIYLSRHNPQFKCVALFDRCRSKVTLRYTEQLMLVRRAWTLGQITKYKLALEPST